MSKARISTKRECRKEPKKKILEVTIKHLNWKIHWRDSIATKAAASVNMKTGHSKLLSLRIEKKKWRKVNRIKMIYNYTIYKYMNIPSRHAIKRKNMYNYESQKMREKKGKKDYLKKWCLNTFQIWVKTKIFEFKFSQFQAG